MVEQVLIGSVALGPLLHLIALVSSFRNAGLWCIERIISQASSFLVTVDSPKFSFPTPQFRTALS